MLTTGKLGFWGLTALVFGLMVGVGIYNLPQNMAAEATPIAVFLGWTITGAGILPLVYCFNYLSNTYPQYKAGLYQYAQAGFGNYCGFNIAWGYWLCSAFSNIAYGVMLNDSVGAFWPPLLNHGWETVVFCSVFIWTMYWIVSRGVKTAKIINTLLAGIKIVMLIFIIVTFVLFFHYDLFDLSLTEESSSLGGIGSQIRNTMMITLFCFFGVEGANMMSARAKKVTDVGRAGIAGFLISIALYMAVSLLCFGMMGRAELSGLQNPSIAYIMRSVCGQWAYWFVISAVVVSLIGGWVAWTLVVSQVPYEASLVGILPKVFSRLNKHNMPSFGLMASSLAMEVFLLIVVMADNVYLVALQITGLMIIPCYFFTGLFLLKKGENLKIRTIAFVATAFCVWMAYAGGIENMIMTSGFYLIGIFFYIKVLKERSDSPKYIFSGKDKIAVGVLLLGTVYSLYRLGPSLLF